MDYKVVENVWHKDSQSNLEWVCALRLVDLSTMLCGKWKGKFKIRDTKYFPPTKIGLYYVNVFFWYNFTLVVLYIGPLNRLLYYVGRRSFPVATSLWNSLPSDIQSSSSLPVFRQRLKTFLFRQSFPDIVLWRYYASVVFVIILLFKPH